MAERQFGPYRLVHQIATGGMAEIYLARTRGFGGFEKYVALKMIHPNFSADEHFIQMLVDEAKITVQLQHVNIAQVFDLGRVGETYYITMEYVDGCDLYKILRKASEQDRPMPIEIAVHVARELCNGLDYAHRKKDDSGKPLGIVHRDISPQNVLLSHAAEVKLVDFGIAKAAMRARQTAVGVIKGKYYYMSPEQAWGDPVDHRTDIFSAGILLYEMLTGQMLYLEEDLHRLLDMVRKADIPLPSTRRHDVPNELERIVMKALAKKPEQRWQSAHDFGSALERFLHARAPDFTTSRLSTFMAVVLGEENAVPPPPQTPEPQNPNRVTRGLDRESLVSSRAEISDDNSVIFRPDELAARARKAEPGRPTQPIQPPPGHPAAQAPRHHVRLADAATPHVQVKDFGDEQTVISGPPSAFGGSMDVDTPISQEDLFLQAPPQLDENESSTLDMMMPADLREDLPTGTSRALADDGTTRIDIGVPGTTRESDGLDDTNETLNPPTLRQPPNLRDLAMVTPAVNPAPAVSALRQPKGSQKTPRHGIPAKHPAKVQVSPSLAPLAKAMPSSSQAPTMNADLLDDEEDERPTISPHLGQGEPRSGSGPGSRPAPALRPIPSRPPSNRPIATGQQMAKPPGSFRPPSHGAPNRGGPPPPAVLPPAPAVMPPPPALKPMRESHTNTQATEAAPVEPAGLNWVFDPEPARTFNQGTSAPSSGGAGRASPPPPKPVQPLQPLQSMKGPPAAAWPPPAAPGPPLQSPPNGSPAVEPGFSDPALYALKPATGKRWRTALMVLAFILVAGAVAIVVAVVASREASTATPTQLEVISIPPGAEVTVNGKREGVTPLLLDKVEPGKSYKLGVDLAKYEKWERQEVVTEKGRTVKVIAALKPILGAMRVESTPPGAEVYLGPQSQSIGRTPLQRDNMDPFVDIDVEVRLKGFKPDRQRLQWGGQRERTLSFKLIPSP